jgi:hypothetical protein
MKTIRRLKITISVAVLYALTQVSRMVPDLPGYLHWVVFVSVIVIAGYVEWSRSAPTLRLQDRRKILFDQGCKGAMARLREHDPTARLNIMEIDGLPLRRFRFLRIIYDLHVRKDDPDRRMRMRVWQGVAGQAVESGQFCIGDIADKEKAPTFGLDAEQMKKTEDVRLVFSMPIKKALQGPDGDTELTDKAIGVVNIDSKMENAPDYYRHYMVEGRSLRDRQEQALREISEYCSFVMG